MLLLVRLCCLTTCTDCVSICRECPRGTSQHTPSGCGHIKDMPMHVVIETGLGETRDQYHRGNDVRSTTIHLDSGIDEITPQHISGHCTLPKCKYYKGA